MTTAEHVRANINANRERDTRQQLQAANYEGNGPTEEVAPGIPSNGNDAALAAHLKEMRDSNAEYAKLRTEEARQQWESIVSENFRRNESAKQNITVQASIARANQEKENRIVGDSLALQMQELTDTFPPNWTPETLPLDKLHRLSNLRQKVQDQARAMGLPGLADGVLESGGPLAPANVLGIKPSRPETFPDGSLYQLTNLPDGNLEVKLITGEVFRGDPISVTRTIAESKVHTRRWAQQQIAQAQQRYQQPAQQQPTENTNFSGSLADVLQQRQREQIAQTLGYSNAQEMYQEVNDLREFKNQMKTDLALQRFITAYPEYPGTQNPDDPVNQAMGSIFEEKGWQDVSFENLEAAHALAIQRGYYQPLRPETYVQQNNRPTPPPMLRTNNPEVTMQTPDPYNMNLAELRKLAVAQQLGGGEQRR